MIAFLKTLRRLPARVEAIEQDCTIRDTVNAIDDAPDVITLTRHQLGSIDLSDIPTEPTDPEARKNYDALVAGFFKQVAEPELKRFIQAQLEFIGKEAMSWEQTLVGRGTINGFALLLEKWEKAYKAHLTAGQQKPEAFDRHAPFPET